MPRFDPQNAACHVMTQRTGMLGAMGHDLQLRVGSFWVEVDDVARQVTAELDARSVEVLDAIVSGAPSPGTLSARDKREINQRIAEDVLDSAGHPKITFHSTRVEPDPVGYRIHGRLSLHGTERAIELLARRRGDRLEAEVTLHQPDFGIRPFKAFGGALKVRPDVVVRVSLPDYSPG
jgi:polyisoprenoid-binding protein YceI